MHSAFASIMRPGAPKTRGLERVGLAIGHQPSAGMFVWMCAGAADGGLDTNLLAARLFDRGFLLAPGSLFSPAQLPSPWLRFNIATSSNPIMLDALAKTIQEMA